MSFELAARAPVVAVAAVGAAEGVRGAAAALACAGADADRASLLVEVDGRPPRPTLLASTAARRLEDRVAQCLPRVRVAARGQVCHLAVAADEDGFAAASAAATVADGALAVLLAPQAQFRKLLGSVRVSGVMLRADVRSDRALLALAVRDLLDRGLDVGVLKRRLGWATERRAAFGALGTEPGLPAPLVRRLVMGSCDGEATEVPA